VDSEHPRYPVPAGAFFAQRGQAHLLTASGGPFHALRGTCFQSVTVEQALQAPELVDGRQITIDSATLMNKGLEVIEAHWPFGMTAEAICVVIHRQSVIHSMVELVDGSMLASWAARICVCRYRYALTYPRRMPARPLRWMCSKWVL